MRTLLAVDSSSILVDSLGNVWRGGHANGKIYKSIDSGLSWTEKYAYGVGYSFVSLLWEASNGYLFSTRSGACILIRSIDGGENWATCLNASDMTANKSSFFNITEDAEGNIYAGEYSHGDGTEEQAFVYKSVNFGDDWTTVYNNPDAARHTHLTAVDPYTDILYITTGDTAAQGFLKRSLDHGDTWETLGSGLLYKFTTAIFLPDRRLLGTDTFGGKIYYTKDDVNFIELYDPGAGLDHNQLYWAGRRASDGLLVFGCGCEGANTDDAHMIVSPDDGNNWYRVDRWLKQGTAWGTQYGSNFDASGYLYYMERAAGDTIKTDFLRPFAPKVKKLAGGLNRKMGLGLSIP